MLLIVFEWTNIFLTILINIDTFSTFHIVSELAFIDGPSWPPIRTSSVHFAVLAFSRIRFTVWPFVVPGTLNDIAYPLTIVFDAVGPYVTSDAVPFILFEAASIM